MLFAGRTPPAYIRVRRGIAETGIASVGIIEVVAGDGSSVRPPRFPSMRSLSLPSPFLWSLRVEDVVAGALLSAKENSSAR